MSRTRAMKDPFWATAIGKMQPGPARIVRGLHGVVQRSKLLAPYLWFGSGWRTGSKEHGSGRAIDIMVTETTNRRPTPEEHAAAMAFIMFLIDNARALKIQWILYSTDGKNRTRSWNADRGTWRDLSNRGSISANHIDHIHIYFKPGADWPKHLNATPAPAPAPSKPTPPNTGVAAPTPATVATLRRGARGDRVRRLQAGLNKVFPAYRHQLAPKGRLLTVDGILGAHTERWVREFQRRSNLVVDGIVGPATLRALNRHGIRP